MEADGMGRRHRPTFLQACMTLLFPALLGGCQGRTIELDPGHRASASAAADRVDWSGWGLTLSRVVRGDRVDYERLLAGPGCLDRFLSAVSEVGPSTRPEMFADRDSRLAYAINCYNATLLRSIVELARDGGVPRNVPYDLERRFRFRIDGRLQSPAELRREAEALSDGDWRVRLALCDGRETGPPLPRRVFLGGLLDAQLNEVTRSALRSACVVRIDHGVWKRLLVWEGLYELRGRLIEDYEAKLNVRGAGLLNVLLEWSDRSRREALNSAVGYAVAVMPSSPRLNALEPAPEDDGGLLSVLESIRSFSITRP